MESSQTGSTRHVLHATGHASSAEMPCASSLGHRLSALLATHSQFRLAFLEYQDVLSSQPASPAPSVGANVGSLVGAGVGFFVGSLVGAGASPAHASQAAAQASMAATPSSSSLSHRESAFSATHSQFFLAFLEYQDVLSSQTLHSPHAAGHAFLPLTPLSSFFVHLSGFSLSHSQFFADFLVYHDVES